MTLKETIDKALGKNQKPEEVPAVDPMAGSEPFLGFSGGQIARGGEFLETETGFQGDPGELERQIIESTTEHFHSLADIASLEHHPGFKAIREKVEQMINDEREAQENAMDVIMADPEKKIDPSKQAQNLYAINRLKKLRDWLGSQITEYKNEVQNRADAFDAAAQEIQ